jgi:Rrf2 family protein
MLCQLAIAYNKGPLQMTHIGEREGISENYLGQIMLSLKASGIVQTQRGPQGGYFLGRAPGQINLLEIFHILEGTTLETGDTSVPVMADSHRTDTALAIEELLLQMRDSLEEVLKRYTLEDLITFGLHKMGYADYQI